MLLTTARTTRRAAARRSGFTLLEILVVVAIIVILAGVAVVAVPRYIEDGRRTSALAGCKNLATAIEAYTTNPGNPDGIPPSQLADLVRPPFGGPSFLRNGEADTRDPWGKPYNIEQSQRGDGTVYYLVTTTAGDNTTPISQFGIGLGAQPKF
jgi:general secretion pathway protein G